MIDQKYEYLIFTYEILYYGGASENYRIPYKLRRDLYYLNIPLKVQFKILKFLWIEPGVETKYLLGYSDINYGRSEGPFPAEDINFFDLTGTVALRINLFRGLSLVTRLHLGILPSAEVVNPEPLYGGSKANYRDYGVHFGIRYMFNQPE